MRLFALEKFSGTFETLMTAPVSDLAGGAGQVHRGDGLLLRDVAATAGLPLDYPALQQQHRRRSTPAIVGSTFLGIFLLGGLFISLGCCASALTRSQVTAAMISLGFGGSLFLLGVLADQIPVPGTWQAEVLASLRVFRANARLRAGRHRYRGQWCST